MGVFSSDGVIPTSLTPETSSPIRAESVFSLLQRRAEQSRAGGICSSQQLLSLSVTQRLTDGAAAKADATAPPAGSQPQTGRACYAVGVSTHTASY